MDTEITLEELETSLNAHHWSFNCDIPPYDTSYHFYHSVTREQELFRLAVLHGMTGLEKFYQTQKKAVSLE